MFSFRAVLVFGGQFSVACLMARASNCFATSCKEEVEKKRQETEELQNKLQEASAMQALTEASALLPQSLQKSGFQTSCRGFHGAFRTGLVSC